MVQESWRRGIALNPGPRPFTLQRRTSSRGCRESVVRTGAEPAELDFGALAGRNRTADRYPDLEIAVEHSAEGKRGFRWRRPRHTLKGRQEREAVERVGLRLQLRKAQAQAGDVVLLFADESEALTHPYLAHAWAPRGADLRIQAPGQARKVAILGTRNAVTGELVIHTSSSKRSSDFIALLECLDQRYAPRPDRPSRPVVLVLDNGPVHTSKASRAALAARDWITVEWLPLYAPELNDIERDWLDLKRHHLAHRTFTHADQLDTTIHAAITNINREREQRYSCLNLKIAA